VWNVMERRQLLMTNKVGAEMFQGFHACCSALIAFVAVKHC
jgi:hypothetical protein